MFRACLRDPDSPRSGRCELRVLLTGGLEDGDEGCSGHHCDPCSADLRRDGPVVLEAMESSSQFTA